MDTIQAEHNLASWGVKTEQPQPAPGVTDTVDWAKWVQDRLVSHPFKTNLKHSKIAWCDAFVRGDQYTRLDEFTGVITPVNIRREAKCCYNICKPFEIIYVSKMLKDDPIPLPTPYSQNTEEFDEDMAASTNAAVESWWKTFAAGAKKLRGTVSWGAKGGIGIGKIYYDLNARSGIYQGEAAWEVVNPLHFFCNADAREDSEFRWVIHRFPKEKEVAEELFADQMAKLDITSLNAEQKSSSDQERGDISLLQDRLHDAETTATVIVHDIWMTASKKYPNGKHIITIGPYTLVDEDNDFPDTTPFVSMKVRGTGDDLFGLGIIYGIIPIQRDMNRLASSIKENTSEMAHIKWMISGMANLQPGALDNATGEKVLYDGPTAPFQSQAAPLPGHLTNRWWELFRVAQFETGIQDLGAGMVPYRGSQIAPGVAQELKSSEEGMFSQDVAEVRGFVERVVRKYIRCAKKYYQEKRVVSILGANKTYEAKEFMASAFQDLYDVDCSKIGSGFTRSTENKVAAIMQFAQTPLFEKSGVDPRVITEEALRMMGLDKVREDTFRDERQARRNLQRVRAGGTAVYSKFINPVPHIKVFTDFCKTGEWEAMSDEERTRIDDYITTMIRLVPPPDGQMAPPPGGGMPPIGAPGNMPPMAPSPEQAAAAEGNLHLAAGRPPLEGNGQAGAEPPPA